MSNQLGLISTRPAVFRCIGVDGDDFRLVWLADGVSKLG